MAPKSYLSNNRYLVSVYIRKANTGDLDQVRKLFSDTVTHVNVRDYDFEQIQIWASRSENRDRWKNRIAEQHFFLAETEQMVLGFISMTDAGYVDLLYVHRDYQGQQIGTALLDSAETLAKEKGVEEIWADVSITARPFFEKRGFEVSENLSKEINGVTFRNYRMTKALNTR